MPTSNTTPASVGHSNAADRNNSPTPPSMVQLATAVLNAQNATTKADAEYLAKIVGSPKSENTQPLSPPHLFDVNAETEDEDSHSKDDITLYSPSPSSNSSTSSSSSSHALASAVAAVKTSSTEPSIHNDCPFSQPEKLADQLTSAPSRISLALSLEASAAAAAAEKRAEECQNNPEYMLMKATERAKTDKYITEAINKVQTIPRVQRSVESKPVDRRIQHLEGNWSRLASIESDPQLYGECKRLVRGTQGCGRDCDARFTNLVEFAKHVDEKHDRYFRPYMCPAHRCPWAIIGFHERSECTRHIRTKHYKAMYSCKIAGCTKVYNRSDAFRRHVRQAHASMANAIALRRAASNANSSNAVAQYTSVSNEDTDSE